MEPMLTRFGSLPATRSIALLAIALTVACGPGGSPGGVAPTDPHSAVGEFLDAVEANNLTAMGDRWGSARGPASRSMDRDELRKRLTVIQIYLRHERFEFVPGDELGIASKDGSRTVRVRMTRSGCVAIVPFRVVPWSGRWLVTDIDLAPIGNPARVCAPSP
jgi:hypothetical protein